MSEEKKDGRERKYGGTLYPDSESYDFETVLGQIQELCEKWAYIVHDSDVDEDGNPKKTHVHWYGYLENGKTVKAFAKKLGLAENELEIIRKEKSYIRYLIHADSPDKFQYEPEQVTSSDTLDFMSYVTKGESATAKLIFNHIRASGCNRATDLAEWCFENGCWSEFRRSFAIWSVIMRENEVRGVKNV